MPVQRPSKQVISPGTDTFSVDFAIPRRKIPECFVVPPGEDDSLEDKWRVSPELFNFHALDPDAVKSMGSVVFNIVIPKDSLVTIWQTDDVGIDIDFTRNDNFNVKRLAVAMEQLTAPSAALQWLSQIGTLRYAYSADQSKQEYNNVLPALNYGDFFRRGLQGTDKEDRIVAQDTNAFIVEVANAVTVILDKYINLTKDNVKSLNVMLGSEETFSVQVGSIKENGDIVYETLSGVSAKCAVNSSSTNVETTHSMINEMYNYDVNVISIKNGGLVYDNLKGVSGRGAVIAAGFWASYSLNDEYTDPWGKTGSSSFTWANSDGELKNNYDEPAFSSKSWANSNKELKDVDGKISFSSKVNSDVSKDWAISSSPIDNVYGDKGYSAKHWASQAKIDASAAGGVVNEFFLYNPRTGNAIFKVDLIDYSVFPPVPWEDVTPNSFTAYIDGVMLTTPGAYGPNPLIMKPYTVHIEDNPTLEKPSYLKFKPEGGGLRTDSKLQIRRSEVLGDSSTMFANSSNAKFEPESKLMARDAKNIISPNMNVTSATFLDGITDGLNYVLTFDKAEYSPFQAFYMCDLKVINNKDTTKMVSQRVTSWGDGKGGGGEGDSKFRISKDGGASWSAWKNSGSPVPVHYDSIDIPCTFSDGSPQVDVPIINVIVEEIGVSTNTVTHGQRVRRLSGYFHSSPGKLAVTQILHFRKWFSFLFQVHNGANSFAHIPLASGGAVDWNNGTHVNFVDYFNGSKTNDPSVAFNCVPGGEPPTNRQVVRGFKGSFTLVGLIPL